MSCQPTPSCAAQIPAFCYKTWVYSDGKEWEASQGVRRLVTEIWVPSELIAYNRIQGPFYLRHSRPAKPDPCSCYESPLESTSLTETELRKWVAQVKENVLLQRAEAKQNP